MKGDAFHSAVSSPCLPCLIRQRLTSIIVWSTKGNFHKACIRARHCIALAELLGLLKLPHDTQPDNVGEAQDIMRLWDLMCSAERLSGMILNRLPITRRLEDLFTQPLVSNGVIQQQVYLKRLIDITGKFHTLEDISSSHRIAGQAYASALELDRELRLLAS